MTNGHLFALDPGKHKTAVAYFLQKHLQFVRNYTLSCPSVIEQGKMLLELQAMASVPNTVVIEIPRSYPKSPGKANDLIDEAVEGAFIAGKIANGPIVKVHPSTTSEDGRAGWKGQVPKPIHHRRIIKALESGELQLLLEIKPDLVAYVEKACERYAVSRKVTGYAADVHNSLDAVGLGLEYLGRI